MKDLHRLWKLLFTYLKISLSNKQFDHHCVLSTIISFRYQYIRIILWFTMLAYYVNIYFQDVGIYNTDPDAAGRIRTSYILAVERSTENCFFFTHLNICMYLAHKTLISYTDRVTRWLWKVSPKMYPKTCLSTLMHNLNCVKMAQKCGLLMKFQKSYPK
jgi:ABC-type microcin C transport system permease subunit YejB